MLIRCDHFQDTPYLSPIIKEIEAERTEREDLESMQITKPKSK
jgi:ubiquinol-cytochrome c reductase subunit 7